jgi:hypothetical protein
MCNESETETGICSVRDAPADLLTRILANCIVPLPLIEPEFGPKKTINPFVEIKLPFFIRFVHTHKVPPDCVSWDPGSKTKLLTSTPPDDKIGWVKIQPVFAGITVWDVLLGKEAAGIKLVPL